MYILYISTKAMYQTGVKIGCSPYAFQTLDQAPTLLEHVCMEAGLQTVFDQNQLKSTNIRRSPEITRMYLTPTHLNVEACKAPS